MHNLPKHRLLRNSLILLIVAVLFFSVLDLRNDHNWGDDFSAYIGQAEAIAKNDTNRFSQVSENRVLLSDTQVGPNLYPWGYPLLLAPVIFFFGIKIIPLKIATFLFFAGSLCVTYFLFKKYLTKNVSLFLVLLVASSPFFFAFKQNVLSDIPAMFFLLLSLLLIQKIYFEEIETNKNSLLIALGISMFFSVFIRTSSVIILPTFFFVQAIDYKRCFKSLLSICQNIAPYLVFLILYLFFEIILPSGSYTKNHTLFSSSILAQVIANTQYYANVSAVFFGNSQNKLTWFFYLTSIPFFMFGVITNFKKNYLFLIYIFFTLSLFLTYPYLQGLRFLISLIPLYLFFVTLGFNALSFNGKLRPIFGGFTYIICLLLLVYFLNSDLALFGNKTSKASPYAKSAQELFRYIESNTKETDSVAFFKPRAMYLFTKRESARIDTIDFLEKASINYYVFTKGSDSEEMENYLNSTKKLVFKNTTFSMYYLNNP